MGHEALVDQCGQAGREIDLGLGADPQLAHVRHLQHDAAEPAGGEGPGEGVQAGIVVGADREARHDDDRTLGGAAGRVEEVGYAGGIGHAHRGLDVGEGAWHRHGADDVRSADHAMNERLRTAGFTGKLAHPERHVRAVCVPRGGPHIR